MSLETELAALLAAPLATLVDDTHRVPVDARIARWDLPPSDLHALRDWGLPDGPLFRPGLHSESAPVPVPTVVGDGARRLIAPEQRLYLLGSYGSDLVIDGEHMTMRVGAVVGSGQVLGIRSRPLTVADMPPALRAYYADSYTPTPAVRFFNSSVAAFVEVAWRWRAAVSVLGRYPCPEEVDELAAWFDRHNACLQQVLAGMVRIDQALADPHLASLWVTTITEDS